ncbi:MAG: AAA family ATPase [Patescibacteria group bacterium]
MFNNAASIEKLSQTIKEKAGNKKLFVIAISGFGGAGKSTVALELAKAIGNSNLVELDDFILNRLSKRSADWDGFDWGRLISQVLEPIRNGEKNIEYDIYDWGNNKLGRKNKIKVSKYVILEGVGLIQEKLNKFFDYKIWVNVQPEIAKERGRKRDKGMGADHDTFWDDKWSLNDKDYFEKHNPMSYADYIIPNI